MFKKLFNTAIALILKPSEAWKELSAKQTDDHESFLSNYVYPFIGIIAAASFIGIFFTRKEFDIQIALKSTIRATLSAAGGFWLASYILNEFMTGMFRREKNVKVCQRFVGYASSMMFALTIFLHLLPEFFFLRILELYTTYIVWEGAIPYMAINESKQLKFASIATAVIILTPALIEFVLYIMMPGLQV
jgi:uncharacterized membrane protein YfcA